MHRVVIAADMAMLLTASSVLGAGVVLLLYIFWHLEQASALVELPQWERFAAHKWEQA